jgi:AhpD family alkylhydroperoxidase
MTLRLNSTATEPYKAAPDATKATIGLEAHVKKSGIERALTDLIKTRASQINGCAYRIHMHTHEARARLSRASG